MLPIGATIRRMRKERGWLQKQLAYRSGLPIASLSHLEAQDYKPTLHTMEHLAKAFEMPVSELIREAEKDAGK